MPSTPRKYDSGTLEPSTLVTSAPRATPCVCQPSDVSTWSPALRPGAFDSMTSPTVWPTITAPIATGGT